MNERRGGRAAGFSLLEVVVAFAILAIALGALYQIFSSAARQATLVEDYMRALALAEVKLTEAGIAQALGSGVQGGETDDRLRWRRAVEPYVPAQELGGSSLRPYRVAVEVRWIHDGRERAVALETVRLGRGT